MVRDPFELWLNTHVDEGKHRRARDPAGARPHQGGAEGGASQDVGRCRAARQAHRLRVRRSRPQRALHRRRRFGRRVGEAGARQGVPGGAAAQGQAEEHLAGQRRHAVLQQGDRGDRAGDRGRPPQAGGRGRPLEPALQEADHPRRRGRRRRAHPGAAADALLPPPRPIERGHVFVAQPPLFRIDVPGQEQGAGPQALCARQAGAAAIEEKLADEG